MKLINCSFLSLTSAALVASTAAFSGPTALFAPQSSVVRPSSLSSSSTARYLGSPHGGTWFGEYHNHDTDGSSSSASSPSPLGKDVPAHHQGRFDSGAALDGLRADLMCLRENLKWAETIKDQDRVESLTQAIRNGERRDPEQHYRNALRTIISIKASHTIPKQEKERQIKYHQREAQISRAYLSRFHLEGLWVGTYGDHGPQLINVTYIGDTLVATKVTGDATVPRGKVSFTADLTPTNASSLSPLNIPSLTEPDQTHKTVFRYPGKGQIAEPGYLKHTYIPGQFLMLADDHFSFVWIPSRHHVIFRRPTPTQTLHLLRDVLAVEDEVQNMRDHLTKCLDMDMTTSLARQYARQLANERKDKLLSEVDDDSFRRIPLREELEDLRMKQERFAALKGGAQSVNFLHNLWRQCVDVVLGDSDDNKKK